MRAHRGRHQQLTPHLAPPGQHYRADCQASMRRPGRAGGATPRRFAPSPAILWCNRGLDRLAHRGNGWGLAMLATLRVAPVPLRAVCPGPPASPRRPHTSGRRRRSAEDLRLVNRQEKGHATI